MLNNDQATSDISVDESSVRIGRRIRRIREFRALSLYDLAAKLHISTDMLQKYENGQRKPKPERLNEIANCLGVSHLALTDPVLTNRVGAMYALFELDEELQLYLNKVNGQYFMGFQDVEMNSYLQAWGKMTESLNTRYKTASDEERQFIDRIYHDWEWTFPQSLTSKPTKDDLLKEKVALETRLQEINTEISAMNANDTSNLSFVRIMADGSETTT